MQVVNLRSWKVMEVLTQSSNCLEGLEGLFELSSMGCPILDTREYIDLPALWEPLLIW
jgi:hypothetical protein